VAASYFLTDEIGMGTSTLVCSAIWEQLKVRARVLIYGDGVLLKMIVSSRSYPSLSSKISMWILLLLPLRRVSLL
jgi:hypothetical protein